MVVSQQLDLALSEIYLRFFVILNVTSHSYLTLENLAETRE